MVGRNRIFDVSGILRSGGIGKLYRIMGPEFLVGQREYSVRPFAKTRSVFIHIPKAAGTSIAMALYGSKAGGHMGVEDYAKIFSPRALESFFVFTFVRNPFGRLFSAYQFLKNGGMNSEDQVFSRDFLPATLTFDDFVMEVLDQEEVQNHIHFIPQNRFVCIDGQFADSLNFVGRYETLAEDFDRVCRQIRTDVRLPHKNKSDQQTQLTYGSAYTPEMIDKVSQVYAADLDTFGYGFDSFTDNPISHLR